LIDLQATLMFARSPVKGLLRGASFFSLLYQLPSPPNFSSTHSPDLAPPGPLFPPPPYPLFEGCLMYFETRVVPSNARKKVVFFNFLFLSSLASGFPPVFFFSVWDKAKVLVSMLSEPLSSALRHHAFTLACLFRLDSSLFFLFPSRFRNSSVLYRSTALLYGLFVLPFSPTWCSEFLVFPPSFPRFSTLKRRELAVLPFNRYPTLSADAVL